MLIRSPFWPLVQFLARGPCPYNSQAVLTVAHMKSSSTWKRGEGHASPTFRATAGFCIGGESWFSQGMESEDAGIVGLRELPREGQLRHLSLWQVPSFSPLRQRSKPPDMRVVCWTIQEKGPPSLLWSGAVLCTFSDRSSSLMEKPLLLFLILRKAEVQPPPVQAIGILSKGAAQATASSFKQIAPS